MYNRVDKINVNDQKVVANVGSATKSFGIAGASIKEDTYDAIVKDNLNRFTNGKYVPKRGQGY